MSKCEKCGRRQATIKWVGEGGIMAFVHGMYHDWCEKCALEAKIKYAEEHQGDLQKLRKELKEYEASH